MYFSLVLAQPPPSLVAIVSGGEADPALSNLKVRVRSEVKPGKSSGRRMQIKTPRPPAGFTANDKEVLRKHLSFFHLY